LWGEGGKGETKEERRETSEWFDVFMGGGRRTDQKKKKSRLPGFYRIPVGEKGEQGERSCRG